MPLITSTTLYLRKFHMTKQQSAFFQFFTANLLFEFQTQCSLLTAWMSRRKISRNPLKSMPAVETLQRSAFFLKHMFKHKSSIPLSSYSTDYLLNTLTTVGASNTLSSVTSMHTNLFSSLIFALLIDKVQFSERLNLSLYSGTSSYCTLFFVEDLKAINTGEPSGFS